MISTSYLNEFNSPIRQIKGRAEVFNTSAFTTSGEGYLEIDNAPSEISAKLTGGADYSGVTVACSGKNLFNSNILFNVPTAGATCEYVDGYYTFLPYYLSDYYHWSKGNSLYNGFLPNTQYTFSLKGYVDSDTETSTIGFYFQYSDGTRSPAQYLTTDRNNIVTVKYTSAAGKTVTGWHNSISYNTKVYIKDIQLEMSSAETEYEEYKGATYSVAADGTIETIKGIRPYMLIIPSVAATVEATYNKAYLSDTFSYNDKLKSITIDRTGEQGKFFGFGVCQKATVNVLDRERLVNIGKGNYVKIDFRLNENDFVSIYPDFFVSEAKRDENTNELTIVASDYLEQMLNDNVSMLGLGSYTIREFAAAASSFYGLNLEIQGVEDQSCFDLDYPNGANFEGTESIRSALNSVAEVTQTIYFISGQKLIFKRLNLGAAADLVIEKQHYYTLESKDPRTLGSICHATELGDNVIASSSLGVETQYVRDNPFWELREDLGALVEGAIAAIAGITITPFSCSWRGNFLLEPGDQIELVTKDDKTFVSYVLNDKINYTGGFSQTSEWSYDKENETAANPSTLGEVLKQTYAKVDKANKQIDMVVSDVGATKEAVSALQLNTNSINASVQKVEKDLADSKTATDETIAKLTSKVEAQITAEDVTISIQKELENGVDKVVTSTGYKLDSEGFSVTKTESDISTTITNNGVNVSQGDNEKLVADKDGVKAEDLHATTFLIIGKNSRFEDYGNRTACFWIGG